MRFAIFSSLISLVSLHAQAAEISNQSVPFTFDTYENMKDKISFPKYTSAQRRFVAQQAKTMFDVRL